MKYERLTHQKYDENIDLTQEYGYSYIYKRLYELEDKIEAGILVELSTTEKGQESLLKLLKCLKTSSFDQEFKYSFISLARSFLFNLSDEELYHYYVTNTIKESSLYLKCLELVKNIDVTPAGIVMLARE